MLMMSICHHVHPFTFKHPIEQRLEAVLRYPARATNRKKYKPKNVGGK